MRTRIPVMVEVGPADRLVEVAGSPFEVADDECDLERGETVQGRNHGAAVRVSARITALVAAQAASVRISGTSVRRTFSGSSPAIVTL